MAAAKRLGLHKSLMFLIGLILFGIGIYILLDCYALSADTLLLFHEHFVHSNCDHSSSEYPNTYYKKRMDGNCTFNVFSIQIGQVVSAQMNQSQIRYLSDRIEADLLWYKKETFNQTGHASLARKATFRMYYSDRTDTYYQHIDNTPNLNLNLNVFCHGQRQSDTDDEVDFFEFIQDDAPKTNDSEATAVNFYGLLPIEDVLNDTTYTSKAKDKYSHIDDEYYLPQIYTYTLSVAPTGYLPSLELRFGEICNEHQHAEMKHLMLNRNQKHLLWAGELYYFYDYKFRKYVLMVDNASGHWKPSPDKLPDYIEELLYRALFPRFNLSVVHERGSLYGYTTYYRPLVMVGHDHYPWEDLKSLLFPVLGDIQNLYQGRKEKNKENKIKQLREKLEKQMKTVKKLKRQIRRNANSSTNETATAAPDNEDIAVVENV